MLSVIKLSLISIAKKLVMAMISEKVLKLIIIEGSEKLAKKTDNDMDDKIVAEIKKALQE